MLLLQLFSEQFNSVIGKVATWFSADFQVIQFRWPDALGALGRSFESFLLVLPTKPIKRHNLDMENDFAAVVQKYVLYVLVGIGLFAVIGAVVVLISSIL